MRRVAISSLFAFIAAPKICASLTWTGETPTSTTTTNAAQSDVVTPQYKLFGFRKCDGSQIRAILNALADKTRIMACDEIQNVDFNSAAAVDFFGQPSVLESYRSNIQATLRNVHGYNNGWFFQWNDIEIFCGDGSFDRPEHQFLCKFRPGHVHFVNEYNKHDGLMFCNSWFGLRTLDEAIRHNKGNYGEYDMSGYENQARHWISALIQKKGIATWPKDNNDVPLITYRSYPYAIFGRQWMTTASAVKLAAKYRDFAGSGVIELGQNADTWSWFVMAAFLSNKAVTGEYPALPYVPGDADFEWRDRPF